MDTPILNFGPGKSGKGITNINESTNNKKQIDLSNLKIKKNPEEIIEKDFQGNLSTLSTGTGFFGVCG